MREFVSVFWGGFPCPQCCRVARPTTLPPSRAVSPTTPRCPAADCSAHAPLSGERRVRTSTPEPERLRTFAEDMFRTDPVAERFVDEVYCTLGLLLRLPAVTLVETLRRVSPTFRRLHEKVMCRHRENWHRWQSSGRPAEFAHGKGLRR